MENKAILDKLLNEQIVGFDLDEDTMPNTPRRLRQSDFRGFFLHGSGPE
jgi:hypothetical protein